jgi:hypothetical protein
MRQRRADPLDPTLPSVHHRTAADTFDALVHLLAEADAEDDGGETEEERLWASQLAERSSAQVAARCDPAPERDANSQTDSRLGQPLHEK